MLFRSLQDLLVDANRAGMERFYDTRLRAIEGVADPARRLVITIMSGLPVDADDEEVRLLCALGGEAAQVAALFFSNLHPVSVLGAVLGGDRQLFWCSVPA